MLPSWHPTIAYVNSSCANRTLTVMVWTWAHMVNGWFPTDGVILGDAGNFRWGLPGRKGVMGDAILKSISGPYLLLCFLSAMKSTASSTCSPPPAVMHPKSMRPRPVGWHLWSCEQNKPFLCWVVSIRYFGDSYTRLMNTIMEIMIVICGLSMKHTKY